MHHQHTLMQGDNAQAVVTAQQIIVGQLVTRTTVDHHLVHPSLPTVRDQLTAAGIAPAFTTVLADVGDANEVAFARAEADGVACWPRWPKMIIVGVEPIQDHRHLISNSGAGSVAARQRHIADDLSDRDDEE
jgi:hypothetical protein